MQNTEEEAALPKSEADSVDEGAKSSNPADNVDVPNNEEEAAAEGKEAAEAETEEEPLTIVLIGMAGVGKSTAINRMLTSIDADRDTV